MALQLVEVASAKAARASIDPDSFDTSTEYEAALERRSRGFQVLEITRGGETSRWRVTGSGPSGPFDLDFQAASAEDAGFQARWDRSGRGTRPMTRDTASDELARMYEVEISGIQANPVTLRELYDAVLAAVGQGSDSGNWNPQIVQGGEGWNHLRLQMAKLRDVFRQSGRGGHCLTRVESHPRPADREQAQTMAHHGRPPDDRLGNIRQLLARLEKSTPQSLDAGVKTRIAEAWRLIENNEPDADAPWRVDVLDPETAGTVTVGIGYHENHGFDAPRGEATLRYAAHRAALRWLTEVAESDLYDAVHALRPRLQIVEVDRRQPEEEDLWYVLLNPGSLNGRPRLPIERRVPARTAEEALALAQWRAHPGWRKSPLSAEEIASRIDEMTGQWRVDDVRVILPTIYELASSIRALDLAIPDTADGRRVSRMIEAVRNQTPPDAADSEAGTLRHTGLAASSAPPARC